MWSFFYGKKKSLGVGTSERFPTRYKHDKFSPSLDAAYSKYSSGVMGEEGRRERENPLFPSENNFKGDIYPTG